MKRMIFHLTDDQIDKIKKISKVTGMPMAEYIRRSLDAALKRDGK